MSCPRFLMFLAPLTLCVAMGCSTTSPENQGTSWPTVNALPTKQPEALKRAARGSMLRRGDDGFLYVVGGMNDKVQAGANFLVRYAGEWPIKGVARPPLAAGQIVRRYGKDVALAHMSYSLPNVKLDNLIVTWTNTQAEDVGKGLGRVTRLTPDERGDLELSIGESLGVQVGDIYGLIKPKAADKAPNGTQFGRRLSGLCMVSAVSKDRAQCRVWKGSTLHPGLPDIAAKDEAIFFEHTYGKPPRQATLQFSNIKGDTSGALRKRLVDQMNAYIGTHSQPNAKAVAFELDVDATRVDFYHIEAKVPRLGGPQVLIGGTLKKVDGEAHLFINYTGIGSSVGAGMVAAPPEGGIDLGPVENIDGARLRQAFGLLWSAALVYRGQQSEGLAHLRQLLSDKGLQGSMRWHARDQYAMRWAALGRVDEALWLVLEDEAVARAAKDGTAELNAMGTRVRLYDMLKVPTRATALAKTYLERRKGSDLYSLMSARAMYAEMLLGEEKIELAKEQLQAMEKMCPDGCDGDLFSSVAALFWSAPASAKDLRSDLLTRLGQLAPAAPAQSKASLWLYRGVDLMQKQEFGQSVIAFMEAERLFTNMKSVVGMARVKYFLFLAHLAQEESIKAIKEAIDVLKLANELNDYTMAEGMYNRVGGLSNALDPRKAPAKYVQLISRMLMASFESQLATGDLGKASETLYAFGDILLKSGGVDEALSVFRRSVVYAMRTARFDVAALGHLTMAVIARLRNDRDMFTQEIARAQLMAKISGDPQIQATIERVISPDKSAPAIDSKLL